MDSIKELNSPNPLNTELNQKLALFQKEQFSGSLNVTSSKGFIWKIYFCLGRLIWADGGIHPNRSWRRNLAKYCPEIKQQHLTTKENENWDSTTYQMLAKYLQEKTISRDRAIELINDRIQEFLFDVLQEEAYQSLSYSPTSIKVSRPLAAMLRKPLALVNSEEAIKLSHNNWFGILVAKSSTYNKSTRSFSANGS